MYSFTFTHLIHYIVMIDTFCKAAYSSVKLIKTHF